MNHERGATWNMWDLHVHSPASFHQEYGLDRDLEEGEDPEEAIWDRYISELEDLDEVSCVGITDYFSIDGYERVRKAKSNGRLQNLDLVIPNIELRVDHFVTSRSDNNTSTGMEMHVLFSDELQPATIRDEFISNLDAKKPNGEPITPTRSSLERLGNNSEFEDLTDREDPYVAGCNLISVDVDTIVDALGREEFKGKYLTVLVEDGWEKVSWNGRSAALRSGLLNKTDVVFTNESDTREWLLGKSDDFPAKKFRQTFGSLKPGLRGSDSHSFTDFCEAPNNEYCWIKADTTFEGLSQIKYEPEDRVHIGPRNPQARMPIYTPDEFRIQDGNINETLSIADTTLPLNPNLVTVIGGKGAGKTALLDLLANCYKIQYSNKDKSDESIDVNSFIRRIQSDDPSLTTEIDFSGEDVDTFSKSVFTESKIEHSQIEYLPQGQIAQVCRNDDEMHNKVLDLVLQGVRSEDPDLMERFDAQKTKIEEHVNRLEEMTNEIYTYNPQSLDRRISEAKSKVKAAEGRLTDKEQQIAEFKKENDGQVQEESTTELQQELDEINNRISDADNLRTHLKSQQDYLEYVSEFNSGINDIQDITDGLDIDISINTISIGDQKQAIESALESAIELKTDLKQERSEVRNQLNELEDLDQELSNLHDQRRECQSDLSEARFKLSSLQEDSRTVENIKEKRRNRFIKYVQDFHEYQTVYSLVISEFSEDKSEILDEVSFSASIDVKSGLKTKLFDALDGRQVSYPELEPVENNAISAVESDEMVKHYVTEYLDEALKFKQNIVESSSVVEFEQRVFSDIFKLSEQILLDEIRMEDLSLGQKGTVLLKILLAQGDKPLIIDQPEENLDNKFIYRTLKDAFREAKKERQVIIATHNANLVVNTDAEQVVVAEYDENEISFKSGALENPSIREEVTTILEGGKKAFIQREEKYGLAE